MEIAKKKGLCFNCLKEHDEGFSLAANCSFGSCKKCGGKHHTVLHKGSTKNQDSQNNSPTKEKDVFFTDTNMSGNLKTFMGYISDGSKTVKAAILLDDGSTDSFITENLANRLKLPCHGIDSLSITHFGSTDRTTKQVVISPLTLKTSCEDVHIKVIVVPTICTPRQNTRIDVFRELCSLPLVETLKNGRSIDLLIASDFYYSVVRDKTVRLKNGLVAVDTKFGYIVCGSCNTNILTHTNFCDVVKTPAPFAEEHVPFSLKEWSETSDVSEGIKHSALDAFLSALTQHPDTGQYTTPLPWLENMDKTEIPSNRAIAYHRAKGMIAKMSTYPSLFLKLKDIFDEYLKRGFISKTDSSNYDEDSCSYLPWHVVHKSSSLHTKVRVVFDASCKDRRLGLSLNDFLWKGPNLVNSLVEILLRFRIYKIASSSDIEKAFLTIKIQKSDRRYLRFFYLKDPESKNFELATYNFEINIFGSRASSFILAAVLKHHLGKYSSEEPLIPQIQDNLLVDNLVTGCSTETEAIEFFSEIQKHFQ